MSVNLVNGDTLNSDFTAICNAIRTKGGASGQIAYAPGNPSNIVGAINNISGGGGGIPTFTETVLAEDTNSTGTLNFNGADYHDYELIKCYLKNTSSLREFEVLMTPQCLDDIFQYFGSGICFNQYNSSIFAYYDENSSGNWVRGASDRLICTKVCGLEGQGFTINVTNLYRKQAVQSTSQVITTQLDLNDFDCIIASANNNTTDCVPCCYVMSGIVHNDSLRNQMPNVANAWANAQEIVITEHEISSYNWFCVDAVKFT